uniref:Uncharacterized protein n=1 Tax=Cacopsylla melanoneura TaxID=428564 RepID=A0A8D9FD45_9HEMI
METTMEYSFILIIGPLELEFSFISVHIFTSSPEEELDTSKQRKNRPRRSFIKCLAQFLLYKLFLTLIRHMNTVRTQLLELLTHRFVLFQLLMMYTVLLSRLLIATVCSHALVCELWMIPIT